MYLLTSKHLCTYNSYFFAAKISTAAIKVTANNARSSYRTYETKDKKWVAVGALEPKFNSTLFEILGMDKNMADMYADAAGITAEMEHIFKSKTRDEWMALFEGKNACVSPVLNLDEAVQFRHNIERANFVKEGSRCFPQPAPRMYTKEEFKKLMCRL
ncbi:hypothetical protein ANCCAN_21569 [Ancylostoma caninum]|uniref:Uncharacterized protein n=1 Tax=Ancylostoma caninum TaxID=29170 RepID=A0A368FM58_ANCCA|nr:hypothetical protein ANCCAN_21569 [Ancylostoma caninum]